MWLNRSDINENTKLWPWSFETKQFLTDEWELHTGQFTEKYARRKLKKKILDSQQFDQKQAKTLQDQ